MGQYTFQATGYAGGLMNVGLDTEQELYNALGPALATRGLRAVGLQVEADEWDVFSRLFSNTFHYRATTTVETTSTAAVAFAEFVQAVQTLTGYPVIASNLTAGDPSQSLPDSNPLPGMGLSKTTLTIVAVIVVGLAVVLWEAK
jgi:hypothetical protein